MHFEALPWFVLFLPLLATVVITFFTQKDRRVSGGLSIAAVLAGFILTIIFVAVNGWKLLPESVTTWLTVGNLQIDLRGG